ncbi:hypothetical protein [Acinetobacter sp. HY1485]|uniref:hypothetical protein n=1 Tax=Acinetobacter sp. HY1485 TaxID=2970918 RepID=UPI0022B9A0A8|nr:hypothetical protein [Acinetobacter sp. HY1485]
MALINCPECKNTISDTALNCPQCGVIIREARRGFWGVTFKWLFILFNLLMVGITFKSCSSVAELMNSTQDKYSQAGYTLGLSVGMGALLIFWAAVDIILGLCVILTKPKQSYSLVQNRKKETWPPAPTSVSSNDNGQWLPSTLLITLVCLGIFYYNLTSPKSNEVADSSLQKTYENTSKPKECYYLTSLGLKTGDYYNTEEKELAAAQKAGIPYEKDSNIEYACISDYLSVGNSENQMAYYAYGNSENVDRVVLTLGISDRSQEKASLKKYSSAIALLYQEHTNTHLNQKYLTKIIHHQPFQARIGKHLITLEKNGNQNYGLNFEIK